MVRSLMAQTSGQVLPDAQAGGSRAYVWSFDNLSEDSDPSNGIPGDEADVNGLAPASDPGSRHAFRQRHD